MILLILFGIYIICTILMLLIGFTNIGKSDDYDTEEAVDLL